MSSSTPSTPHAARARELDVRAERQEHARRIARVVGIGEHAADRRDAAHAHVRDLAEAVRQRAPSRRARPGSARSGVRRHGAEHELVALALDARDLLHAARAGSRSPAAAGIRSREHADERAAGHDERIVAERRAQARGHRRASRATASRVSRDSARALSLSARPSSRAAGTRMRSHMKSSFASASACGERPVAIHSRSSGVSVSMNESESAACSRSASGQPPCSCTATSATACGDRVRVCPAIGQPAREMRGAAALVVVDVGVDAPSRERSRTASPDRAPRARCRAAGRRAQDAARRRARAARARSSVRSRCGACGCSARAQVTPSPRTSEAVVTASSPGATAARTARRRRSPTRCPAESRCAPRARGRARPAPRAGRPPSVSRAPSSAEQPHLLAADQRRTAARRSASCLSRPSRAIT